MVKKHPTKTFHKLYQQLNSGQKKAVDAIEGPVMVLAGPGTGKTQVLAMRIAKILQETQMDPWNILCLTFTESGVVAMRERLISIMGPVAYYVRIHTFHSFCNEVMQEHPEKFALARNWNVLSDVERVDIFRSILDDLPGHSPLKPFGNPYLFLPDLIGNIKALKQEDISSAQYQEVLDRLQTFLQVGEQTILPFHTLKTAERTDAACQQISEKLFSEAKRTDLPTALVGVLKRIFDRYKAAALQAETERGASKLRTKLKNDLKRWWEQAKAQLPKQQELKRVYEAYQEHLHSRGRYDYEDMIIMVVEQLKRDDALLARYQEQFQYILVDEYQDTNGAQNETVYLLGSFDTSPNIFVVGDDKQSIYRFQGASLNNMLSFYQTYKKHVQVISLKENYRSTQTILDAAQAVIAHNQESITKYIRGVSPDLTAAAGRSEQPLQVAAFESIEAEDGSVAQACQRLIAQGVDPNEIAVLYRTNRDGEELWQMMKRLKIPARLEIGENVLADVRVRQWLALLNYLQDIRREDLLAEILHYPWWNLNAVDILRVIHYTSRHKRSVWQVISDRDQLEKAQVQRAKPFLELARYIATWRQAAFNTTLQNFLDIVVNESGWLDYVVHHNGDAEALHKLITLLNEAKQLNQANPRFRLPDFMRHIQLLEEHGLPLTAPPWQITKQAVHLMTAHRAKGQEFRYVFITRLTDRHWGNRREFNRVPLPQGLVRYDYVAANENNEDERRLFYVALTRAKEQIFLNYATHSAEGSPQVPSLFIEEIPRQYVEQRVATESAQEEAQRLLTTAFPPLPIYSNEGVREWLKARLEQYVLSVTHLNNYLQCPRIFYFRNLLQVPSVRTKHQAFGSAIHAALRDFFERGSEQRKLPTEKYLLERFRHHIERQILTEADLRDSQQVGVKALKSYYRQYQDGYEEQNLLEYNFDAHGVHVDGIPITGQLDKIEIPDKTKRVNVVDYKTGNPDEGVKHVKPGGKYHRQLVFYKLLCDVSPRFPYTMTSGEIDFIQPSVRTGKHVKKKVIITPADLDDLKTTIKRVWKEIQALRFLEADAGCGECEYCKKA